MEMIKLVLSVHNRHSTFQLSKRLVVTVPIVRMHMEATMLDLDFKAAFKNMILKGWSSTWSPIQSSCDLDDMTVSCKVLVLTSTKSSPIWLRTLKRWSWELHKALSLHLHVPIASRLLPGSKLWDIIDINRKTLSVLSVLGVVFTVRENVCRRFNRNDLRGITSGGHRVAYLVR